MNRAYFTTLADYNAWADNKAIEWVKQIDDGQWNQAIISSFSSIRQTAVHIASAEKIWIDFWQKAPDPVYLSAAFDGSKSNLIGIWQQASAGLKAFIINCPEDAYLQPITFRYPEGGEGRMAFWQTFSHIINHSTYHRGQLVTLLRQAGFTNLSSIDLATYYLLHQP